MDTLEVEMMENNDIKSLELKREESEISEEAKKKYMIWKKNAKHLYDYIQTSSLLWPSLTFQWLPDVSENSDDKSYTYRLLTGSFTSGLAAENLKISKVTLKKTQDLKASVEKYDLDSLQFFTSDRDRLAFKKITGMQEILHEGDINKARFMPQKPDLIASINSKGSIYAFDRTKHLSNSRLSITNNQFKPQISLPYHKDEGFGLSWNSNKEGYLLSGAMDGDVALWDIRTYDSRKKEIVPNLTWKSISEGGVNDVQWAPFHDSIFASVGEDKALSVIDTRTNNPTKIRYVEQFPINTLDFNLNNMFCVAIADSEGNINILDLRNLDKLAKSIDKAHAGSISVLQWNQHDPKVFATGGNQDNLVKLWDASLPGNEELIFVHGGHMLGINDISWNSDDKWLIGSVANDNSLQIWKPSRNMVEYSV